MWQNHLNYPGSSAQAITIKATPALGSNKHTPHEGESRDITTTCFTKKSSVVITTSSRHYYKTKLSKTVIQTITLSSEFEKQRKEKTTATTRRKGIPS